jgi:hypothetical protein
MAKHLVTQCTAEPIPIVTPSPYCKLNDVYRTVTTLIKPINAERTLFKASLIFSSTTDKATLRRDDRIALRIKIFSVEQPISSVDILPHRSWLNMTSY